jgi:hypothetical protein
MVPLCWLLAYLLCSALRSWVYSLKIGGGNCPPTKGITQVQPLAENKCMIGFTVLNLDNNGGYVVWGRCSFVPATANLFHGTMVWCCIDRQGAVAKGRI